MREHAEAENSFESIYMPGEDIDPFYSVELPVSELGIIYQFKIWRTESMPMFITVREDSNLLPWLRPGDRVKMKYYPTDLICPQVNLETEIREIRKQEVGRLRGLYLVDLKIMEGKGRLRDPWRYPPGVSKEISFNALLNYV